MSSILGLYHEYEHVLDVIVHSFTCIGIHLFHRGAH